MERMCLLQPVSARIHYVSVLAPTLREWLGASSATWWYEQRARRKCFLETKSRRHWRSKACYATISLIHDKLNNEHLLHLPKEMISCRLWLIGGQAESAEKYHEETSTRGLCLLEPVIGQSHTVFAES